MASQFALPQIPNHFRFEFDPVNKILRARLEGRFTEEALKELCEAARKYSTATDARAGILDLSLVTEFAVSAESIRQLAEQEPAVMDASRPRIVVAPSPVGFGLVRMFQIMGEPTRPLLRVVRSMDDAFAALGIQSPRFELLESCPGNTGTKS